MSGVDTNFQQYGLHVTEIKHNLKSALSIIRNYDWLLDAFVLDFFVADHWKKLPKSWSECFDNVDPKEIGNYISNGQANIVMPLSLMSLITVIHKLSLTRNPTHKQDLIKAKSPTKSQTETNDSEYDCSTHPKLENLFLKHVKLKKRHEILLMSDIVKTTSVASGCESVVDFGSGVGHLVRSLAYKHNMNTVGVEEQSTLIVQARKLDEELEYIASKHLTKPAMQKLQRPQHVNLTIGAQTSFHNLSSSVQKICGVRNFGLIGLHPCGDLGPDLLKCFIQCPNIKFICMASCCYMKLTCGKFNKSVDTSSGYPLSQFVKETRNNHLSFESREISCHAIEMYSKRLQQGDYNDLKIHSYRAALEKLLVRRGAEFRHVGVKSVKYHQDTAFERYCELAMAKFSIKLTAEEMSSPEILADLARWKQVVIFYSCRLILAPLVETVILLDRLLFLKENGIICDLKAVFDPLLSPRNHILTGIKCDSIFS